MTLRVVLRDSPDGGFWAQVPTLPNCYAQSDTEQGAIDGVRQAVIDLLDSGINAGGLGRVIEVEL